jgi:hypothetical protein
VNTFAYAHGMEKSTAIAHVSWPELLRLARELFGERLTAVILTGDSRPGLAPESDFASPREIDRAALGVALEIAEKLLALETKPTIQAWFVGKNTLLDDRSPALVVRSDPDAVRRAARQFAAYG